MIHHVRGNIFGAPVMAFVNPVNCVGVMGKGLAEQYKRHYPAMFDRYKQICDAGKLSPGKLHYADVDYFGRVDRGRRVVINFPTKDDWRDKSEMQYIEDGLKTFVKGYEKRGITSVAFPPLGCGLGGLDWAQVSDLMVKYLGDLPIDVYIYHP